MTSAMTFGCLMKLNAHPSPEVKTMMSTSWMMKRVIGWGQALCVALG